MGTTNHFYDITLRVVKEEADTEPENWDWRTLIDSRYPIEVLSSKQVGSFYEDYDEEGFPTEYELNG